MHIIINIFFLSVAVFVVAQLLRGITLKSYGTAVVVALVYAFLSWLLGGILTFLSLPFIIITFGLFKFVINAVLLWLTDALIPDFKIKGVGTLLVAAFLITIIDYLLHRLI
ncbi:phage holin family protein [candidate division KSB1 bacterium]|nr:phage holin family protein [candidate division KSB1 bacterium]